MNLEDIEIAAWASMYAAAPAAVAERLGLERREIDGATCFRSRIPTPELNRMLGMTALSDAHMAALEPGMYLQAPPSLVADARARGLGARSSWVKLRRASSPPAPAPPVRIEEIGPADAGRFAEIFCQGYELPPALAPWHAAIVGRPGWRAYLAFDGDTPIASALLFRAGDLAWLGAAATLRAHRGKGAQKALIARRIADAEGGTAVTETGVPAPGKRNVSLDNLLAAGFEVGYERVNCAMGAKGVTTR